MNESVDKPAAAFKPRCYFEINTCAIVDGPRSLEKKYIAEKSINCWACPANCHHSSQSVILASLMALKLGMV